MVQRVREAFRWESINIKDSNKVWHQGIVNNRRIRIHQSKNKIHLRTSESYTKSQINDVISYLRLNDDMKKIYSEISNDKYISSAIETYSGLHLLNQVIL